LTVDGGFVVVDGEVSQVVTNNFASLP